MPVVYIVVFLVYFAPIGLHNYRIPLFYNL